MKQQSGGSHPEQVPVRIRIGAHLDASWTAWFDGLEVRAVENGDTWLVGTVADQPALHGLLARIRDLGLPLLGLEVGAKDGLAQE